MTSGRGAASDRASSSRLRLLVAALLLVVAACRSSTTTTYDLSQDRGSGERRQVLEDGGSLLLTDSGSGSRCWIIATDLDEQTSCGDDSATVIDVDQLPAGEADTAVGGRVGRNVRKVQVTVDVVKRDAKLKDGFFLRLMPARGPITIRALDGDGTVLREWTAGAVPASRPQPTAP